MLQKLGQEIFECVNTWWPRKIILIKLSPASNHRSTGGIFSFFGLSPYCGAWPFVKEQTFSYGFEQASDILEIQEKQTNEK